MLSATRFQFSPRASLSTLTPSMSLPSPTSSSNPSSFPLYRKQNAGTPWLNAAIAKCILPETTASSLLAIAFNWRGPYGWRTISMRGESSGAIWRARSSAASKSLELARDVVSHEQEREPLVMAGQVSDYGAERASPGGIQEQGVHADPNQGVASAALVRHPSELFVNPFVVVLQQECEVG